MFNSKQLTVLLGGLGAIVVLAAGAQFAVGGQPDKTRDTRAALHGGKAKNVIFSSATAWATRRSPPLATTSTARRGI